MTSYLVKLFGMPEVFTFTNKKMESVNLAVTLAFYWVSFSMEYIVT